MRVLLLSSASILACVTAGQAMAQRPVVTDYSPPAMERASSAATANTPARPIGIGQTIRGTIGPEDPRLQSDRSSYEIYRVQVPAGYRVVTTLTSAAFQPVLSVGPSVTEGCDNCRSSSGETTRPAVVTFTSDEAGPLEIMVNTMTAGEAGAFTLNVTAAPPPQLRAQPIVFGQSKTGTLTESDPRVGENGDGQLTDAYAVRLTAGQQVEIELSSPEFDAKLELFSPSGRPVAEDDDSGPGTSARIRYTATRAGIYQIRASSLGRDNTGAYTLRAGPRAPVLPFPPPRPLVLGTPVAGAINQTTPSYEDDGDEITAVRYSFNAVAGNAYTLTANKRSGSELDPRISVGKLVRGTFESEGSDDDGGQDMNSALRFRPTQSGVYIVEVSAVGESLGAYDVKVTQSPPDREPGPAIPVTFGTDHPGALTDGGSRNGDDILFNTYSVALTAGQRVTLQLNSGEENGFDPKLEIGRGTPSAFDKLDEDDDGGTDVNARLRFIAPTDGVYLLRATALSPGVQGNYVLRVNATPPSVLPPEPTPIQAGQALAGSLASTDPSLNETTYYDRYVLTGQVGETYEISVNGGGMDVIVGARSSLRVDDDYLLDDDSGGGTNAKLVYTISTPGPQTIRVSTVNEESTGDYTISVIKK